MPWNCLCSSKSRSRRPQISAPILNTEDIRKLQLIPSQKSLISPQYFHEQLIQPNVDGTQPIHNSLANESNVCGDNSPVKTNSAPSERSDKQLEKRKKQQEKQQLKHKKTKSPKTQKNKKNNTIDETTKPTDPSHSAVKSTSRSALNVTFDTSETEHNVDVHSHSDLTVINNNIDESCTSDRISNGDYDSLPAKIEKSIDDTLVDSSSEKCNIRNVETLLSIECGPSDPSANKSPSNATSFALQNHNDLVNRRFFTFQTRNAHQNGIYEWEHAKTLPILVNIPTKTDQIDKSTKILYQPIKESIDHHFEWADHLNQNLCQVCHEFLLVPDAVKCLTCGLVCHHACTLPQNHETNTVISNTQTVPSILSHHQNKDAKPFSLNYVTERILAIVLPPRSNQRDNENNEFLRDDGTFDESMQDAYERELISKLEQQHGKNYKLFDLESCISAITLEKLCELYKHLDAWLKSGREKVVILQDRGDRQRLGSAIAAYLEYLNICGSGHVQNQSSEDAKTRHHLDMDIFSMKKFLEDVIGPLSVPSHRRYLRYFSGLLSGKIRINSFPLYLRFVTVESPPSWLQHEPIALQQAEWRSFIKIYEGLNCVFTSDVHVIPITTRQFIYEIGQLQLRGDVIIRCYQISMNDRSTHSPRTVHRELIFSVQFHTCAIKERDVTFFRNDLDYACDDPRVPSDHKITLHFSDNKSNDNRHLHIQSPLIKIEPLNSITKYNSLERFDDDSLHTQGPLDGSLYATILKSPKSSLKSPRTPPAFISNIVNNNHRSNTNLDIYTSTPKPNRSSSTQNLISPPPEFNNKKIVEIKECYTTINPTDASSHKLNGDSLEANKVLPRSYSSTPTYEEIQIPSRSSSREPSFRYQTAPRSSSSLSTICKQPNIPQRSSSVSRIGNYAQSQSNHYRTIENCHYVNAVPNNSDRNQYQVRKEATKSPLTLSIDSGISSAAPANRRNQGSSVSPSIPKRTQERHEELDDILSDMLLTVQGISDIKTASNREVKRTPQTQHQIKQRPQLPQLHLQIPKKQSLYGNTNTVKRSQSYTSQDDSDCSTVSRSTVHTTGHIRDRVCGDFYDTASTTTITPTPSESGRITPFLNTYTRYANDNILTQQAIEQRERELIMDLQNQSVDYSQSLRSVSSASAVSNDLKANNLCKGTEDDESIPYHAREDSRPFTYGDARGIQLSPTSQRKGTGMIKLQAGLSSPSLVRKHLGSNANNVNAQKSPTGRNDFEEMLLQRREKILNDKYTIGDKTPNGNSALRNNNLKVCANNQVDINSNTQNEYQNREPLKRSNTMDGGFGRGGYDQ